MDQVHRVPTTMKRRHDHNRSATTAAASNLRCSLFEIVIGGSFSWQSITHVAAVMLTRTWICRGFVGIKLPCHPLQNMMVAFMTTLMSTSLRWWRVVLSSMGAAVVAASRSSLSRSVHELASAFYAIFCVAPPRLLKPPCPRRKSPRRRGAGFQSNLLHPKGD